MNTAVEAEFSRAKTPKSRRSSGVKNTLGLTLSSPTENELKLVNFSVLRFPHVQNGNNISPLYCCLQSSETGSHVLSFSNNLFGNKPDLTIRIWLKPDVNGTGNIYGVIPLRIFFHFTATTDFDDRLLPQPNETSSMYAV